MVLIVYTTSFGTLDFGKFNQKKFSAFKPNPGSGTFTVKDVDYKDSAVYFCAVSKHSVITTGQSCTKTHCVTNKITNKNIQGGQYGSAHMHHF